MGIIIKDRVCIFQSSCCNLKKAEGYFDMCKKIIFLLIEFSCVSVQLGFFHLFHPSLSGFYNWVFKFLIVLMTIEKGQIEARNRRSIFHVIASSWHEAVIIDYKGLLIDIIILSMRQVIYSFHNSNNWVIAVLTAFRYSSAITVVTNKYQCARRHHGWYF